MFTCHMSLLLVVGCEVTEMRGKGAGVSELIVIASFKSIIIIFGPVYFNLRCAVEVSMRIEE